MKRFAIVLSWVAAFGEEPRGHDRYAYSNQNWQRPVGNAIPWEGGQ